MSSQSGGSCLPDPAGLKSGLWGILGGGDVTAAVPLAKVGPLGRVELHPSLGVCWAQEGAPCRGPSSLEPVRVRGGNGSGVVMGALARAGAILGASGGPQVLGETVPGRELWDCALWLFKHGTLCLEGASGSAQRESWDRKQQPLRPGAPQARRHGPGRAGVVRTVVRGPGWVRVVPWAKAGLGNAARVPTLQGASLQLLCGGDIPSSGHL